MAHATRWAERRIGTALRRWCAAVALLAGSLLAAGGARAAVTTIAVPDTGAGCIDAPPDAVPYGQTLVAPTDPTLRAFTVYLAVGDGPRTVRGEVYAWDDAARRAVGPALYQSAPVPVTASSHQAAHQTVTFAAGGVPLAAGAIYLLAVTTLRDPNAQPSTLYIGCRDDGAYPGGAFYTNGGADLTTGWAPFGTFDLAFAATFGTAPAPSPTPSASPSPSPSPSPVPSATPSPSTSPPPSASPVPSFADVPPGYWAHDQIGTFAQRGITTGCDVGLYCPERPVTRAEMAVFLDRTLGYGSPATPASPRFIDVPAAYWAYAFIGQFATLGITTGCGGTEFCPDRGVTRAEMAAFLIRALKQNQLAPGTPTFADVPASHPQFGYIEALVQLGVTTGCGTNDAGQRLYCPDRGVTRAEMAVFIIRAFP